MSSSIGTAHEQAKARIVDAEAADTVQTRVFDINRGYGAWPAPFAARALRNEFFARWHGREGELEAALATEQPDYERAVETGDVSTAMILAGEAVDLIGAAIPAAELVRQLAREAEAQLRIGATMID